jgi:hypothetical protein
MLNDKAKRNLFGQRLAIVNAILDGNTDEAKVMCIVYISSVEGFRLRGFVTDEEAPHLGAEINRYLEKLNFSV